MLKINNLCKTFGGRGKAVAVLDDVSFSVAEGELVVVLGPSGCGKTTLLRIVAGLEAPSSGQVIFDGSEQESRQGRIGFVFQEPSLFPWLTVSQNVMFSMKLRERHVQERKESVDEFLRLTSLEPFAEAFPKELSVGMQQRVAIARSLAAKPEVLLLDEPFSALDVQTREKMQTSLLEIRQTTKMTAVFVTHSVEEGVFLADRIIILSARPATVVAEREVSFSRRRTPELKRTEEFFEAEAEFVQCVREHT